MNTHRYLRIKRAELRESVGKCPTFRATLVPPIQLQVTLSEMLCFPSDEDMPSYKDNVLKLHTN